MCFCFDEHGRKKNIKQIQIASRAQWALLDTHREILETEALAKKVNEMPGGWKDEESNNIFSSHDGPSTEPEEPLEMRAARSKYRPVGFVLAFHGPLDPGRTSI